VTSLLTGLSTGLALIVAIGAQNAFVLRQGLRREHVGLVVAVCAVSDLVLIGVGVAGLGRLVDAVPWFVDAARWGGAAFLAGYALLTARRALSSSGEALDVGANGVGASGAGVVGAAGALRVRTTGTRAAATALALTWLNPHVYLDTVVLLGSVAASHGGSRTWFAVGAMSASVLWFCGLGYGARHLGRWLRDASAWRVLDGVIAGLMLVLAATLVLG
jgi:L-lysine exporter family protein LysE/ArgO